MRVSNEYPEEMYRGFRKLRLRVSQGPLKLVALQVKLSKDESISSSNGMTYSYRTSLLISVKLIGTIDLLN